ncbi:MAG: [Clostridia bacterium]|nr:[citrate (pro-3S)-lyase] ligase [Clostridia bacterium]
MELEYGAPLRPWRQTRLRDFLARQGLDYDERIEYTVNLLEDEEIVASGSLSGNIFKCIAVDPARQGEGLTATVITELRKEAFRRGIRHLFLYTKPKNRMMFSDLDFYPVAETVDTLLMENTRNGARDFAASLETRPCAGTVGAVVANFNPFTLGHRYLMEQAAAACELLHVFILSEDKSLIPAAHRLALARAGTADLENVIVHPTGDYLISAATFPTYFIQDKARAADIRCDLDLEIFCSYFAPALGITRRFVGTEPLSPVTEAYNRRMMVFLPPRGIQVTQFSRREQNGAPISASRVRALLAERDWPAIARLVPETTLSYLRERFGSE